MKETWSQFPSAYLRLIAMGIDAYNLASRLNDLETNQYPGATGNLSLTSDNRIKRNLVCAKFIDGQPEVTGFIQGQLKATKTLPPQRIKLERYFRLLMLFTKLKAKAAHLIRGESAEEQAHKFLI